MTPHKVVIVTEKGTRTFESVGVARLTVREEVVEKTDDGIVLTKQVFGETVGLPDPADDIYYIVSGLVKAANPDRHDLVSPAGLVRDDDGNVIGCSSLSV
jgi:hypothetical protein